MARSSRPLFLERSSYRQRRVMDAVRLVALFGAGLWMVPLLWPSGGALDSDGVPLSRALLYVFVVWWILIGAAFVLAGRVKRMPEQSDNIETW